MTELSLRSEHARLWAKLRGPGLDDAELVKLELIRAQMGLCRACGVVAEPESSWCPEHDIRRVGEDPAHPFGENTSQWVRRLAQVLADDKAGRL